MNHEPEHPLTGEPALERPLPKNLEPVFVGVGANIDAEANIESALAHMMEHWRVVAVSTFYWCDALGKDGLPDGKSRFLNGAIKLESEFTPEQLKHQVLRPIEARQGRVRTANPFDARPLDLDILLWGNRGEKTASISIPCDDILNRPFVALPLYEIAGNVLLPQSGQSLEDVVARMNTATLQRNESLSARLTQRLTRILKRKE